MNQYLSQSPIGRWVAFLLVVLILVACATKPKNTPTMIPTPTVPPTANIPRDTPTTVPMDPEPTIPTATSIPKVTPTQVPAATATTAPEATTASTSGPNLSLHGQGDTAILMANMSYGGASQWNPFVDAVNTLQFTVITFDFLLPIGQNYYSYASAASDIGAVLRQLRNSGYKRLVCIGADLGAMACESIAHEPEMIGLVIIACSSAHSVNLGDVVYPKLFIVAEGDSLAKDTRFLYNRAGDPKELVIIPGTGVHGSALLTTSYKDQFLQALLDFLNKLP